ncbi:MAG: hypothetical protein VZR53_05340 [Prevotella sp.]|nr:hypothetical protein [Prevotella sp.]
MQRRLNSTQIENAGVDAVSDYFNFTDTLDPSIPKKDKEPVWDGKLFLYKNGSDKQSKTDLIGFIPVQVKGRQFKDFSNSKIKYLVSANDVKLYQNNGGVAFFVVYVNVDTSEKKIYYSLLAPIELRKIAKIAGNKKEISIEFKELPDRGKVVELEFLDFYNDCLKQHSFSNQKPIYFQDVENEIASLNIQFTSPTNNQLEALQQFTSRSHFCYVTLKNDPSETPHPLGEGRFNFKAQRSADVPVTINGVKYYDKIDCEIIDGKAYIVIDNCLRLPFSKSPNEIGKVEKTKVNVEFKSLSQRIRNFEFILALKDKPIINISDTQFKIEGINVSYEIERILDADRNLKTVLDILNVSEDLRIDNLSDREIKNINTLIDHYINGKCIKTDDEVDHQLVRIELGNLTLLFLAEKVNEPNFYKFHSIHDLNNFVFSTRNDLDQHILMPPFVAFNTETFRDVCNITYEDFMGQCEQMKSNDNRYYQAINWSILRMLNAYDQQETKKQVLIDVAKELNQWLIDNDPDKKSSLIHLINRLQITKRIQELSQQEKDLLYDYIDAPYPNDELRFACYTLLDDKQSASRYLSKFTEEKREFYKTLPIYNLYINLS